MSETNTCTLTDKDRPALTARAADIVGKIGNIGNRPDIRQVQQEQIREIVKLAREVEAEAVARMRGHCYCRECAAALGDTVEAREQAVIENARKTGLIP